MMVFLLVRSCELSIIHRLTTFTVDRLFGNMQLSLGGVEQNCFANLAQKSKQGRIPRFSMMVHRNMFYCT